MEEFEQIYSKYYDVVFHYALLLCQNELLAEEITQETFFKALKSVKNFRGECKLDVWLCQITKNTYNTYVKRQQRQANYPLETISSDENVLLNLINKETALQIHRLLHKMDEPYKEVFWMRTFGELSFKEIAAIFGKTESWARVTYHRAKIKLKEELQ